MYAATAQPVNLVQNSNFDLGNTGFTSSYIFSNDLVPEGRYSIVSSANTVHPAFRGNDHTNPPTGLFMAVNGAGTPMLNVWCENVTVAKNTDYAFTTWVSSLELGSPALLQFSINGVPLDVPFQAPANTNTWIRFFVVWNSGNNTNANICIVNQNTTPPGNDFGLDDITFIEVCYIKAATLSVPPICSGSSVQLSANGGDEYIWSPVTGLNNPKIANPIASPSVTTQYKVIARSGNCIDSSFVTVVVNPIPNTDAGKDTSVCINTTTLIGTPPQAGISYSWSPTTGLTNPNASQTDANPNTTTVYILNATGQNGCVGADTVVITVIPLPKADAGKDKIKCPGSSVQIGSTPVSGVTYSWFPVQGLSNPNASITTANPIVTTTYIQKATNINGCLGVDTVVVRVDTLPTANAGRDTTICKGDVVLLGVPPKVGNTYSWKPATGIDNPAKSNPYASPIQTTLYTLTVTNPNGCVKTDSVVISLRNIAAKVSKDTSVCLGSSVQLNAGGGDKYIWTPSAGLSNPTIANPISLPDSATRYKVTVSSGNCIDSAFVTVGIAPDPIADAGKDTTICIGGNALIGFPPVQGNSYEWKPATGLLNPKSSQTVATPTETTAYILTLINEHSCKKLDTVVVEVRPIIDISFTLSPAVINILPGQPFSALLHIPSDVQTWKFHLDYNELVVEFDSILEISKSIATAVLKKGNPFTMQGTGENGDILLKFNAFLPQSADTAFLLQLTVDSAQTLQCRNILTRGSTLEISEFCGKGIRLVQGTGKSYYLQAKENGINFGIGLSGRVRLELYDYMGGLRQILTDATMDAGEYSIDLDLPTGVYFCRISAGRYEEVRKVMVLHR